MGRGKARGGVVNRRGRWKAHVVIPFMGRNVCPGREPDCLARGKRRGVSPGAAARHRSPTRVPQILSFSGWLKLGGSLFSFLFFTFFEIGLHSLSNLRSEGNWRIESRCSDARRLGNAENLVRSQKKWGKKEKRDVRSQK